MKLKRIMAIALCLCMVFGTMNFTVSAEDHSDVIASVTSEVIKDDLTLNVKFSGKTAVESYKDGWWMNVFFTANKDLTFGDSGADGYFVISHPVYDMYFNGPLSCPKSGTTIEYKAGEKIKLLDQYWVALNFDGKTQQYKDLFTSTWNGVAAGVKLLKEDPGLYGEISLEIYEREDNVDKNHIVLASESFGNKPVDVAKIGNTPYKTLDAAIAAASNGDVVTVISDIVVAEPINIEKGKELTLDLNGYVIQGGWNGTSTTNHIYAMKNYGTLTITDNSEAAVSRSADNLGAIVSRGIYNYGKLTLENGIIDACDGNGGYAVNNEQGSEFIMNGGKVIASFEDDNLSSEGGYDATAIEIPANSVTTLNGGEVIDVCDFTYAISVAGGTLEVPADSTVVVKGAHGAVSVASGVANIAGGTFKCEGLETKNTDNVIYTYGSGVANISGGTFAGDKDTASGGACIYAENGKVTVTGGTFGNSSGGDVWGATGTAIKGGSFENLTQTSHITVGAIVKNGDKYITKNENGEIVEASFQLSGKGTEAEPYLVKSVKELEAFRESVNKGETKYSAPGVYVALDADLDLSGINWTPIGSAYIAHGFMGNFDGNGHKISNLTITNPPVDGDGYVYAGLFGVTEGTDKNNQNFVKNLTIENVTISTTGQIVAAAIAYPYYTIVENVTVCGDIAIKGGNYTAGVLAYTRRCVNASNLTIKGNEGSYVEGAQVVGGVISDIQMNGGLIAQYSDFSAEGLTIKGDKNVGGISGIIATQTLNKCSVKNVTIECADAARKGIVSGCFGGVSTISDVTAENVTGANAVIGASYDNGAAIEAKIGDTYYATLQEAVTAAKEGETIELIKDIKDLTITVDKSIEITGNVTADNVSISGSGANTELTVKNISFTGNSWIDSNGIKALTVSGVNANVTPSNTSATNSRSAFISLGRSEGVELKLTVENSKIVSLGGSDPILGWAKITEATLTGNTFGSASNYQTNSDSVKFMSIADGAVFNITGNTVYSNYNGIVFAQNTTRDNKYTANISGNTFVGGADHIWIEITGGNTVHATINASSTNTVNGNPLTIADIKAHTGVIKNWSSYAGVDVVTNAEGKVIGGNLAFYNADAIAKGYKADANGEVVVDSSRLVISSLEDLIKFRDAVNAGDTYSGETVTLAADIDLSGINWTPIGSAYKEHGFMGNFDGNGHKISNLTITNPPVDSDGYVYAGLFGVTEGTDKNNQNFVKNLTIENVTISTTGDIVAAAIAYPYYTIVENVNVCGNIAIKGGDYTAGVLAYTRRCVNASKLTIKGNEGSYIEGAQVVGGVISDIQMNGGLIAQYSDFSAEGLTIKGDKNVGGISGIIATQTLNKCSVKNVTIECADAARKGIVSGCFGGVSTISDVTAENVTGANAVIGASYDNGAAIEAKIGDTYYATLQVAVDAVKEGETITLLNDITVTTAAYGTNAINYAKAVNSTIDLNGKTLTSDVGNSVFRFNITGTGATEDITVTIKNGTVVSGANTWCTLMTAGISENAKAVLNLEDVDVYASKAGDLAIKAWQYGLVNAKNVNVYATNGAGGFYAVGGEIVLDDCTVDQKGLHTAPYLSMALAVSTNGKLTVNSGNYSSVPTAESEGYNQGSSHGSWVAGVMNSGGALVINGGTFTNGNFGDDSLATNPRGLIFRDTYGSVEINGGIFNALANIIDYQNNLGIAAGNLPVTIKGGKFSKEPTNNNYQYIVIPEGYVVDLNADGTYSVIEAPAGPQFTARAGMISGIEYVDEVTGQKKVRIILLSGIDSLDYAQVGFKVTVDGETHMVKTSKVFLSAKVKFADGKVETLTPGNFGEGINYIFGEAVNFPEEFKGKTVEYTPFAIVNEGDDPIFGNATVAPVFPNK